MITFLVYNQIGTLRRLTRRALEKLGAIHIIEINSLEQAKIAIQVLNHQTILICEIQTNGLSEKEVSELKNLCTLSEKRVLILASIEKTDKESRIFLENLKVNRIYERSVQDDVLFMRIKKLLEETKNEQINLSSK